MTRIAKEADRASQVVERIRAFMKRGQPNTTTVAMNDLITEVVALTRYQVLREGVSLQTELTPNLS
jgi:hypothetical protein